MRRLNPYTFWAQPQHRQRIPESLFLPSKAHQGLVNTFYNFYTSPIRRNIKQPKPFLNFAACAKISQWAAGDAKGTCKQAQSASSIATMLLLFLLLLLPATTAATTTTTTTASTTTTTTTLLLLLRLRRRRLLLLLPRRQPLVLRRRRQRRLLVPWRRRRPLLLLLLFSSVSLFRCLGLLAPFC